MENQVHYYGIAEEAIVRRFKKRIAALEAANTGLDKLIAAVNEEFNVNLKTKNEAIYALEKEWSKALASAQEIARKFAVINLDDADSLYLRADAVFQKGDFEQVLQLLSYDLLGKNLRHIRSNLSAADSLSAEGRTRIARGLENLRQTIQNALFAARVADLDGTWKRAEAYYDLAVKGDEKDMEVVFEAALYMQKQNQFAKARAYYEKALAQSAQPYSTGNILNNLGILLKANNDMSGAKKAYDLALQIKRELAEKNPDVYLPDVAITLNNLGNLSSTNNDMSGAKKTYDEALQLCRKLAEKNLDVYLPHVAATLNNLGNLLKDNNDMSGAKKAYEEALQIKRKLAEKNLDAYLPDMAMTLNNLGNLLSANNDMSGAQKAYEEALQIKRKLAEKNLDVYLPNVATTLNNLGNLLKANNDMSGAKKAYEEALQIKRELAKKNPDVYLPNVAMTLNNLGNLLSANNDMSGAQKAYEEALQIRKKLARKDPDVYLPYVAMTLNNLGALLYTYNDMSGAKKAYEEALLMRRKLAEKNIDAYLPDVAMTLNNLGALLYANNDMNGAKKAYEEALQIRRKLAGENPDVYLPNVATILNNLGILLKANNDMSGAKKAYEEALQIYRQLARKNPERYNLEVAITDINIGLFYEQLLKNTVDMSLKKEGLDLMRDANQRLIIFPEEHPQVKQYRPTIQWLTKFFEDSTSEYNTQYLNDSISTLDKNLFQRLLYCAYYTKSYIHLIGLKEFDERNYQEIFDTCSKVEGKLLDKEIPDRMTIFQEAANAAINDVLVSNFKNGEAILKEMHDLSSKIL
ncbi:MAG: tetratricopeptide repeat protein [Saprospiraceae bacterium]